MFSNVQEVNIFSNSNVSFYIILSHVLDSDSEILTMNFLSPTCCLHTNALHFPIAISSLPFSIHIHIHTGLIHSWFIIMPVGYGDTPAFNISEISSSLKAKTVQTAININHSNYI